MTLQHAKRDPGDATFWTIICAPAGLSPDDVVYHILMSLAQVELYVRSCAKKLSVM